MTLARLPSLACLALALLCPPAAHAAELPAQDLPAILGLSLEKVYERLKPEALEKIKFTLVAEPPLRDVAGISAFGKPVRVFTRQEARDQQLAYFVSVSAKAPEARQVVVHYTQPAPALFGTITLAQQDKGWAIVDHKSYHSSSGARYFYGEMYDGVECRDDTEMAERWNYYRNALRPKDAEAPPAGNKCPGPVFPDVNSYRIMKQLYKPKASEPASS